MIAMALMCGPKLIIADEPTTALDVTIQIQVLVLLRQLQREFNMGLIFITHDLGLVARFADRVAVMYAGQVVEIGPVAEVLRAPQHPYTQGLLQSLPGPGARTADGRLGAIRGTVPSLRDLDAGCGFRNRCDYAQGRCADPIALRPGRRLPRDPLHPEPAGCAKGAGMTAPDTPLIELRGVECSFPLGGAFSRKKGELRAVRGIDLAVRPGEVVGLVGESGCGKTTLARIMMGLQKPTSGEVLVSGQPIASYGRRDLARRIQPIFQDPYSSLNPRWRVGDILALPLQLHGIGNAQERHDRVIEIMGQCGLDRRFLEAFPAQLSGGQRQRVAIARALIVQPELIICDEPTSALDVSVQAQILNLLQDLRERFKLTYLFISHNLAVVEHIATRVCVMYLGRFVEEAPKEALFSAPRHPYTAMLLDAVLTHRSKPRSALH
jgi:peptide/nickel transport system ATP-binding protein